MIKSLILGPSQSAPRLQRGVIGLEFITPFSVTSFTYYRPFISGIINNRKC
jgi:hypothetical protein